jgi:hypothetical protein
MSHDLKIFVVDTGPLITLAIARSLDYLLFADADLIIPDAVLHEATFDAARLGAQDIIDWVKAHRNHVEIAPTKAYQVFDAARASIPNLREPSLGERAAVEVIEEPDRLLGNETGRVAVRGNRSAEARDGSRPRANRRTDHTRFPPRPGGRAEDPVC